MKSHGFHWVPGSAGWPHLLGCRSLPAGTGRRRTATFQALSTAGFRHGDKGGGLTRKNMVIWHLSHEKHWDQQKSGIHEQESEFHQQKINVSSINMWFCQQEHCFNRKNTWFNQQSCKRMCLTRRTQTEMGSYSLNWWSIKKVLK